MAVTPPSKLLLTDLVSTVKNVPPNYIRPINDRPNIVVKSSEDSPIPLIDLQDLYGLNHSDVIKQIGRACQFDGFFQVKNHGVPEIIIEKMLRVAKEFYELPESERLKCYSEDTSKTARLSTSFNVKNEMVSNWRDYLRLYCYPLEDFISEWPTNPPSFRTDVAEYCSSVRGLAIKLLEAISESLGLDKNYICKSFNKHGQHIVLNHYPPCPEPELTFGLSGHTDPNAISILLQDNVPGLQVLREGNWINVNPVPNTFIVNIGDQLQVLSNGRYKSVLHRVIVNGEKGRFSVPTFYCPSEDAVIGPAPELVDDEHPSLYREFTYGEYFRKFWSRQLGTETTMGMFRVTPN
ncbi:hypothetical protein MKW98_015681 [Papaver atlanticum]|uniref:Fe2OG dioxygenase domain-containing protein n=1 Tax=Papaver atlanticum TaxID=357466 RepID=A0AAD4XHH5_9MAGN|nr:hypothetical protein MKW98_015681 [Papaver atlanticum]